MSAPARRRGMAKAAARITALVWRAAPVHLVAFLVVTLVAAVTPIAVAWFTKLALDELVTPGPVTVLIGLSAGLAAVGLLGAVVPQVGQYLRAELDRRAKLLAKDELFAAVERFAGLARFEDPVFLDRLRLAEQSASSPGQLVESAFAAGRALVTLVGFVGSLAVVNPWFTAVVLAAAVPAFLLELRLSHHRAAMIWRIGPAQRREFFYTRLLGSVDSAKEIRLLGLGGFLRGRMNQEMRSTHAALRRMDRRELVAQGALVVLAAVISGGGLVWVLLAARSGQVSIGDVAMFVAAVAGVQASVDGVVGGAARLHQHLLVFGHYTTVMGAGADLPSPPVPAALPPLRRGIELRDVWFRYSDEHPWVLRGVDLFFPHGATTALVGHNGSGKSTLVKLLCRFYDPTRGSIHWDGVDIRDVPTAELRDRIGAVFQDFMCYDFDAHDNIAVGDLTALEDPVRVEAAARRAGVHEAVAALPLGYRTLLSRAFLTPTEGEEPQTGVVLSGGQWQRLALARAFLRSERDLMILDEPSAGLDAEAEHEVHSGLRRIRAGRTSLLISHRLGTIRDADRIAVLSGGVVAEQGAHAELMACDGVYARLFGLQASGYTDAHAPRPGGALSGAVAVGRPS
ncbi:ABC transporter ATP-binding protein [Umezawaea tangerina]|uniref:ATP-binding cassette subfamily B protein n=1 Tax=Umezawaea tangerina TaxID=84725 RepID=A0A2T0T7C1_9PSEU|nr:ABC transporter ATP-binding protein [Umezawaea tangerina]PRY41531.1 ATP-binding cassette subfamily B protein [Umezawaea tangerina]